MSEQGNPCLYHRCCYCCKHTEIELTLKDLERLKSGGFAVPVVLGDGGRRMGTTEEGHCVFLDEGRDGGCTVYEFRPDGCRYYPLMIESDRTVTLDDFCPFAEEFEFTNEQVDAGVAMVTRWVGECEELKAQTTE